MGPKSCCFVSFNEKLRAVNFAGFSGVRVGLGEVLFAVIPSKAQRCNVEFNGTFFPFKLACDCGLQTGLVNAQKFGQNTDIDDVGYELCNLWIDLSRQ